MSIKYHGLSRNGWVFFAAHIILFNVFIGHPNLFQFLGGLIGSYIFTRIIFAIYYIFQEKTRNTEKLRGSK